ncbi:MAG: hypothetical protein JWP38_3621 [Herbaspirillum sp.]|nr:hypothetical protein [Herbaspirillum sp.]
MIGAINMFGVFVDAALFSAILAAILHLACRPLLMRVGFYTWVWHRSLVDLAIYVLLWGVVSAALPAIVTALPVYII